MQHVHLVVQLLDHVLPIMITLLMILGVVAVYVGGPICRYVAMVSSAGNEEGREEFAKYLANKRGSSNRDVNQTWQSFIPAAGDLYRTHRAKIDLTR